MATNCADASSESSALRYMEVCLNAGTLEEVDLTDCSSINTFSVNKIRPADIPEELFTRITDLSFTSLTEFNVEDPDAVEEKSGL